MIDISLCGRFVLDKSDQIFLSELLEVLIGGYRIDESYSKQTRVEALYYDDNTNGWDPNQVSMVPENFVGYFMPGRNVIFVRYNMYEKLRKDMEMLKSDIIPINDFDDECLCISASDDLPQYLQRIIWINDDFMNDGDIPFDQDAFSMIERGIGYLNPKHFSVRQLIRVL